MEVDVLIGENALRWHAQLIRACGKAGFDVAAVGGTADGMKIVGLDLVLAFEQIAYRAHGCALQPADIEVRPATDTDIVIDLSGVPGAGARVRAGAIELRPLYDGSPDPAAAVFALLDRRAPKISVELRDSQGSRIVARGTIALADFRVLSRGLNETFTRVASLLVRVLREVHSGIRPATFAPDPAVHPSNLPIFFAASALAEKIMRFLMNLVTNPEHWRVAIRNLDGEGVLERMQWPQSQWHVLPDDGRRFYADPFVIHRDGEAHLFVEEFPYATGKGILCHCVIEANGKTSVPKPFLEANYHLSYPFVFEHGGEVYMIPETGAARRIELYRAERFPDRWSLDCILVDDVEVYDATLVEHDGRFWIFAALAGDGASTCDALGLFYADNLRGPWHEHPRNPVLVDASSARPAGAIASHSGQLLRAAQDCSEGYGWGMAICKIDTLDPENYQQSVLTRLRPPPGFLGTGVHTLNRCAGVEVIDFKQPLRRVGFDGLRSIRPGFLDGTGKGVPALRPEAKSPA